MFLTEIEEQDGRLYCWMSRTCDWFECSKNNYVSLQRGEMNKIMKSFQNLFGASKNNELIFSKYIWGSEGELDMIFVNGQVLYDHAHRLKSYLARNNTQINIHSVCEHPQ